jgi:2,3-bisphosphoglycerate-dependent phosphoglycerate mutase
MSRLGDASIAPVDGRSTLVLLRHGSSEANEGHWFGGWEDVALAERGIEQARTAGHTLQRMGLRFDVGFTSVLRRATSTLRHCLETLGQPSLPTVSDWRLNERHYGALQGMRKSDAERLYGEDQVRKWRRSFRERPPELEPGDVRDTFGSAQYAGLSRDEVPLGESLRDTQTRVIRCWNELVLPKLMQGQNVLLVAHGNSIRALLMSLERIDADDIPAVEVPNGLPLQFELSHGRDRFVRRTGVDEMVSLPGQSRGNSCQAA